MRITGEAVALKWADSPLGPDVHQYTAEASLTLHMPGRPQRYVSAAGQGSHFQGPFAARRALADAGTKAAQKVLAHLDTIDLPSGVLTRGVRTVHADKASAQIPKGPLYARSIAVVIGINRYAKMTRHLEAAEADARRVATFFKGQGFDVYPLLGADATRQKISTLIGDTLRQSTQAKDRVVIYFAGHGLTEGQGDRAMGYLAAQDTDEGALRSTGVSMLALQRWLGHLPARHVMLLADACYSGLAINSRAGPPLSGVEAPRWLRLALEGDSKITLVAGRKGELAHEIDGQGVFTAAVLNGLRGAADLDLNGFITGDELAAFIKPQVTRRVLQAVDAPQRPQYARTGGGEMVFRVPSLK
ncbi:MAG: caspase domain-containing protein [Bradymonadia bacterium]